jgi:photosystem II stability/assembly factor-like uncharacterized protein
MVKTYRNIRRRSSVGVVLILASAAILMPPLAVAAPDLLDLPATQSASAGTVTMMASALAGTRVVLAGERGIILYSDDGAHGWHQSAVPVSVTLTALYFVNPSSGWAVGHDGVILHSTDGGKTWVKQADGNRLNALVRADAEARLGRAKAALQGAPDDPALQSEIEQAQFGLDDVNAGARFGPSRPLLGVWFASDTAGYVVGSNGQIFATTDGGIHWISLSQQINNPDALHYNSISGDKSGQQVIAGEAGKVYISAADGSWKTLDVGYNGALYGVLQLRQDNHDILLAYGFGGHIFRSIDQGVYWGQVGADAKAPSLVAGIVRDNGEIVLLGQDASLLRSVDGGQHFQMTEASPGLRVASLVELPHGAVLTAGIAGAHLIALDAK